MFLFRGGGNQMPFKILGPIDYFFKQQNISCVKRVFNYDNYIHVEENCSSYKQSLCRTCQWDNNSCTDFKIMTYE